MKTNFNFDETPSAAAAPVRRLSELRPAQTGWVVSVDVAEAAGSRLLDLGFLPETRVEVVRRAPLGDPVVYELRGCRICLRRADAERVWVRVGSESAA